MPAPALKSPSPSEEMIASWGNFLLNLGYPWNFLEVRHPDAPQQPKRIRIYQKQAQPDILAQGPVILSLGLPEFVGLLQDSLHFDIEKYRSFSTYAEKNHIEFWLLAPSHNILALKIFLLQNNLAKDIDRLWEFREGTIILHPH